MRRAVWLAPLFFAALAMSASDRADWGATETKSENISDSDCKGGRVLEATYSVTKGECVEPEEGEDDKEVAKISDFKVTIKALDGESKDTFKTWHEDNVGCDSDACKVCTSKLEAVAATMYEEAAKDCNDKGTAFCDEAAGKKKKKAVKVARRLLQAGGNGGSSGSSNSGPAATAKWSCTDVANSDHGCKGKCPTSDFAEDKGSAEETWTCDNKAEYTVGFDWDCKSSLACLRGKFGLKKCAVKKKNGKFAEDGTCKAILHEANLRHCACMLSGEHKDHNDREFVAQEFAKKLSGGSSGGGAGG